MPHSTFRTPLIDMVKGVACVAIIWHHLAFYGPMSDIAQPLAPALMSWLYDHGRMAVQVFLVLGGYLAATSLAPQGVARFDHAGNAIAKRFVRLIVPYAVALLLSVLVSALVRPFVDHPSVPESPSLTQLVANALLLQDIVGEEALSAGVWYVAIDFQLFTLTVLAFAGVRALPGAWVRPFVDHPSVPESPSLTQLVANALLLQDIVGEEALSAGVWYVAIDFQLFTLTVLAFAGVRALPGAWAQPHAARIGKCLVAMGVAASLWVFNRIGEWDMWAVYFFGSYGLGMLAYWAVQAATPWRWVLLMTVLTGIALAIDFRGRIALAFFTALCLVAAVRATRARSWRTSNPTDPMGAMNALTQLGKMSYSVFLVHFAVCLLVNAVVSSMWPHAPLPNALGMVVAFVLSLVAGRVLYLQIEQHVPSWSMALRWQLGLVGAGLLVAASGYGA